MSLDFKKYILEVPNFPKPGISFKDLTPLIANGGAFKAAVENLAAIYGHCPIDAIMSPEARGFIWGGALSLALGKGMILARKKGKLPRSTRKAEYALEYGVDELHIHADAIESNSRILIFDDVLATGGTAAAMIKLVQDAGGSVAGLGFVAELGFLNGRKHLAPHQVNALVEY